MNKFFYGGEIDCIQGSISIDSLDFLLNLMDEYIELFENSVPDGMGQGRHGKKAKKNRS